jgi:putative transferase (TIGR04331 family)
MATKEEILDINKFYINENLSKDFIDNIQFFESIVKEMVDVMNQLHDVNYSYKFWKILLIDYINRGIQKYAYLSKSVDKGLILTKYSKVEKIIQLIKAIKSIGYNKLIAKGLKNNNKVVHGFHFSEIIEKEIGVSIPNFYPLSKGFINKEKRKKCIEIANDRSDLFIKNLILQLPDLYVEYFDYNYNKISLFQPENKEFHVSLITAPFNKLLIAKYLDHGAKLYYYQHGGGGGEIPDRSIFHDSSYSTNYMTWGWKINDTEIPSKAYRCEGFKRLYAKNTGPKTYDFALVYSLVLNDPIYFNFYKSHTDVILNGIDHTKFKKIIARPRRSNRWKNASSELQFISDKRVKIDSGQSPMTELIYQSKIVVIFTYEWPQTNFSECLYVNHPVISIVEKLNCTSIFKPYYQFFIDKKVFHETSESMVKHLNEVDLIEWWTSVIEEPMYKEFKHTFLRQV